MKRVVAALVALSCLAGCGSEDAHAERCNERGGVYANVSLYDRHWVQDRTWYCFHVDTIPMSISYRSAAVPQPEEPRP